MKISTNGIEIHYTIEGSGPWITLSHSLACNVSMWDGQAAWLKERYTVLRFDTRGHGQSSAPSGPYTLDQMADDVHGLFTHLGIDRTHWVGLSMGGMIGQTYALKYPGRFASMVLADTTARRPPGADAMWGERIRNAEAGGMASQVQTTLARWFTEPFRKARPDVMGRIGRDILATPVAGFCGACHAISKVDVLDRLGEINCPCLVLVGAEDHATTPDMARDIRSRIRDADLTIIPSASHVSNIEQPEAFDAALRAFLARVG